MTAKPNNFQRFRNLPVELQRAIAAAMLERMLPNYQLFSELNDFGDYHTLQSVMGVIWEKISLPKAKIALAKQIEKVEENTPDLAQFDNLAGYLAIDVATSMIGMLHGLNNDGDNEYLNAVIISQSSVARYIEATEQQELSGAALRAHPLMAFELATLEELLALAEVTKPFNAEFAKLIRKTALAEGISNIGLEP